MAARGVPVNQVLSVLEDPAAARTAIVAVTSGASSYTVTLDDRTDIVLTRRFTPTWAIVVSLTVLPVFPLVFLYKENETLTFSLSAEGGGTRVRIGGLANAEMQARIRTLTAGGLWLHMP